MTIPAVDPALLNRHVFIVGDAVNQLGTHAPASNHQATYFDHLSSKMNKTNDLAKKNLGWSGAAPPPTLWNSCWGCSLPRFHPASQPSSFEAKKLCGAVNKIAHNNSFGEIWFATRDTWSPCWRRSQTHWETSCRQARRRPRRWRRQLSMPRRRWKTCRRSLLPPPRIKRKPPRPQPTKQAPKTIQKVSWRLQNLPNTF